MMVTLSLLAVLFLLFGSVLNVVIYRLPLMLTDRWQRECQHFLAAQPMLPHKPLNLFFPRSFCRHCQRTIPIWHNVPLLSYLLLRGKCSQCRHSISLDYPLVEASFCLLALLALASFGFTPKFISALLFIALTISLTWIDKNHQLLPDELTLSLLWVGLITNLSQQFSPLTDAVLGAVGGYLSLWLVTKCYWLLTQKVGMGHGDFKLFAALGAWFGWSLLPPLLVCSASVGALVGCYGLFRLGKSMQTPIPFGPFLCLSGLITLLLTPSQVKQLTWLTLGVPL